MRKDELRAKLVEDMEAVINDVLEASGEREMDLTNIEDVALAARQEFGRRVAQRLVEVQVARQGHELPQDIGGRNLHPKGKKTKRS